MQLYYRHHDKISMIYYAKSATCYRHLSMKGNQAWVSWNDNLLEYINYIPAEDTSRFVNKISENKKLDEIDCLIQYMKLALSPSIGPYDFDWVFCVASSESAGKSSTIASLTRKWRKAWTIEWSGAFFNHVLLILLTLNVWNIWIIISLSTFGMKLSGGPLPVFSGLIIGILPMYTLVLLGFAGKREIYEAISVNQPYLHILE